MSEVNGQANQKASFLEDDLGHPSSMRLMSVTALGASIVFGLISILHGEASKGENGLWITAAFLIGAFVPKALQKFIEVRFPIRR